MKNMCELYFSRFFSTFIFTSIKIINTQVNIMIFLSNFSCLDLPAGPWVHHIDKFSWPSYHVFWFTHAFISFSLLSSLKSFFIMPGKAISKGVILGGSFSFFVFPSLYDLIEYDTWPWDFLVCSISTASILAWKCVFDVFEKKKQRFCVYAKFRVTWSKSFHDLVLIFKKPKKKKSI